MNNFIRYLHNEVMGVIKMKCIYCYKQQQPIKIGGMVTITCCEKIQILRYTIRSGIRKLYENDPDVVLVEIER